MPMLPDISRAVQEIALLLVPVLMGVTFHEVAHGYVANWLGDPTARLAGRLTFNPIKHLDLFGALAFLLTRMIGWAKPVPVDPRYFRDPAKGMMLVALAGPAMNVLLAIFFALAIRMVEYAAMGTLQGSTAYSILEPLAYICAAGVQVNLALAVFNLIPVPPLDGSNVLAAFLPHHLAMRYMDLGRWGFFALLLLAVTGILGRIILPPVRYFTQILL
ncbi:site-2 protease family protein [Solidesulfovibrio carbinolicus]|uniref:Site-2 protease family protein n=1 Tax=Solidesulfovibrio carbinolicus TaxID=296842 RepID=A0A4V0YQP0_9BACT|nr:site-2 protease family protein [Solidesulfovibrio carbinolicus]QAZ66972.1 site-2 protease family protein [Solidesulfovibrio carbinolicus]